MSILPQQFDNTWTRLPEGFFSRVSVSPLQNPAPVSVNPRAAALLGLDASDLHSPALLAAFNGEALLPGMDPIACVYAGHQFGVFVSRLGDGRAILLGEVVGPDGKYDLQIKGSGPTPYSRGFDGRAVLRSCIREYLASEAIVALGIPGTRALGIFTSDTPVHRERVERGTLLVRLARSHLRFGSFEYFHHRGDQEGVRHLADYAIKHLYPHLLDYAEDQRYRRLLLEITARTAELVAHWQTVGFTHGVLNTDNMSVLGDTIDYGPYGFLEYYQPDYCPNHSDHDGRYAFQEQVEIGRWNCLALSEALSSLVPGRDVAMAVMSLYRDRFREHYVRLMRARLGLAEAHEGDGELIVTLLGALTATRADYNGFFRGLSQLQRDGDNRHLTDRWRQHGEMARWFDRYLQRLRQESRDDEQRKIAMDAVNPKYLLRNYLAQRAIEAAEAGDYSEVERLLTLVQSPFDEHPGMDDYARPADPDVPQVAISCSS